MRALAIAAIALLAGCPDKNSPERQMRMAVEQMTAFSKMMCECKDKDCADKVQDNMTKWATEMARSDTGKSSKPDEEMMKKMTDVAQRYAECMTKAMTSYDATPVRDDIPPATNAGDADALIRDARVWAARKQPAHQAVDVRAYYAEANGTLDPQYGAIEIVFGRPIRKADDPKRKIGAPVPAPSEPDDCFQLTWKSAAGWSRTTYGCNEAFDVAARCTVTQIWKRAIERKAPAEGLATLSWRTSQSGGSWELRIQDEPRGINFVEAFADDCPLAVEK